VSSSLSVPIPVPSFSLSCSRVRSAVLSFPTRRSSDLILEDFVKHSNLFSWSSSGFGYYTDFSCGISKSKTKRCRILQVGLFYTSCNVTCCSRYCLGLGVYRKWFVELCPPNRRYNHGAYWLVNIYEYCFICCDGCNNLERFRILYGYLSGRITIYI